MTTYESSIKQVYAPQGAVYAKLSDLTHLSVIKERMDDPAFASAVAAQVPADKLEQLRTAVEGLDFSPDTVTVTNSPIGPVTLAIVERDEPKCVKFELQNAPIKGNLWIQMLPPSDTPSKMRCTVGVDMNFFMRKMIEKQLKEGVEKLAEMLSRIPYGY